MKKMEHLQSHFSGDSVCINCHFSKRYENNPRYLFSRCNGNQLSRVLVMNFVFTASASGARPAWIGCFSSIRFNVKPSIWLFIPGIRRSGCEVKEVRRS